MSQSEPVINDAAFRTRRKRWLAHTSEFVSPLLRTVAMFASRGAPSDPSKWRKGLILGHNHIGDVLYRTCSLEHLRIALPQCEWTYLTSPSSAELLRGNPFLSEVLPWATGENSGDLMHHHISAGDLKESVLGDLRRREFDVALCTNTLRHYSDLALAVLLGIPNRVAFSHKGLTGLITRRAPIRFPSAYAEYFRGMVADLAGRPADWPLKPRIFPDSEDRNAAGVAWNAMGLSDDRPVVACSITTRQGSGNWPREHLLGALGHARSQTGFDVVLCGAPADSKELAAAAKRLSFPVHILAGVLGLRQFAAFLERCTVLLTLDSGPRHIGNAAGIPVLFARNLSHSRVEAGKYCDTEIDLAPPVEYLSDRDAKRAVAEIPVAETSRRLLEALASARSPRLGAAI